MMRLLNHIVSTRDRQSTPSRRAEAGPGDGGVHLSLTQYRDFAETASDWFWEMGPDLRFTFMSRRISDDLGIDPAWYIGRTRQEIADTDQDPTWAAHLRDLNGCRPFRNFRYRVRDSVGRSRVLEISGKPLFDAQGRFQGYRGTGRDVTDRVEALEAHQASEARYRELLDSIHDGVFIAQDERFVFCNRRLAEILDREPEEIVGASFETIVHPETLPLVQRRFRQRVAGQNPPNRYEVLFLAKNRDEPVVLELHSRLIEHEGRSAVLGTVADITEQKRTQKQLQRAQRLEAVGQFTGGLAHDFNNLLTVILGNLELLQSQGRDHPKFDELIGSALNAGLRGAELTRQLLAFSRRQVLEPRVVDVNELVAGTTELLRRTLGEQVQVSMTLAEDLWPALADPAQLESALANLAINARDAMPTGGWLTIETANKYLDARYAAENIEVTPGDYAMVAVSDTGTGIPPEVLSRVFEPFYTTKDTGKGSGLGLSMIYGFAKQSGGHVKIYSEPGHGTTVRLYLPRAHEAARAEQSREPEADRLGGTETVLVVEDNEAVREVAVEQLTDLGYRVLDAEGPKEALRILDEDEPVDLLFTDVVMPGGMTGRDLAQEARRRRSDLAVLFTSGFAEEAIRRDCRPRDKSNLLSKPYRQADLARKVRAALQGGVEQ